ncbi:MAG: hypothetical protein JKY61_06525 [Planctomycetes bacterium]|nr:hypothetical protein [Planctomycetota bacterium]
MKLTQIPVLVVGLAATSLAANAQSVHFSVDWRSPSIGVLDSTTLIPIVSGDILTPAAGVPMLGPLAAPSTSIAHDGGGLGLLTGCVGLPGGSPCPTEVDALSFGMDDPVQHFGMDSGALQWSVDTFALGFAPIAPNVMSEALFGESAADVMRNVGSLGTLPAGGGPPIGHRGIWDGDGLVSGSGYVYAGLGLIEPSSFSLGFAATGDNLDALDVLPAGAVTPFTAYFSLDSDWIDPLTGLMLNASAPSHGYSGADVLVSTAGSAPMMYAPAPSLGLDLFGISGADDLDALALWDNGDGLFTASSQPFDWLSGSTDMLLFSVRRGSDVIGMPDSIFGLPIEEGDILTTPLPTALGGVSPFPGIFIAAEVIGLNTVRSGMAFPFGDDLNALSHRQGMFNDCDGDGIDDTHAIATGLVLDFNTNGIPDVCESYLTCTPYPNSTGVPTVLAGAFTGSPGSGFHLESTSGPSGHIGYVLVSTGINPLGLLIGSGNLCLSGALARYNVSGTAWNSVGLFDGSGVLQNLVGTSSVGSGFDVPAAVPAPIGGVISTGTTLHFQLWHRDTGGTSNFSNSVTF